MFSELATYFSNPPAPLGRGGVPPRAEAPALASDGPFGKFDKAQLQRGFQVYSEVCSACHSLNLVAFRDLKGLGYNEAEIKKIASDWKTQVPSINPDTGEAATRKALPSDNFPSPFANEIAARAANNNALPPDLSLMTKAREGGAAYVYSLLTGYRNRRPIATRRASRSGRREAAAEPALQSLFRQPQHRHAAAADQRGSGHLRAGQSQADGRPDGDGRRRLPGVDGRAEAGEPACAGLAVSIFLLIATILGYFAYQQIWYEAKRAVRVTGALEPENQAKSRRAKAKAGSGGLSRPSNNV